MAVALAQRHLLDLHIGLTPSGVTQTEIQPPTIHSYLAA